MNKLRLNNIQYSYGKKKALSNISFEVTDGLIGILGPNGAGKTTAMKLITTLFSIQQGDIFLNDLNYKKDLKEVRKNIGYLPQDFSTYGTLKGREFLQIVANLKLDCNNKKMNDEINEIISKLNMNEYIDRKIKEYSGGMKQKLGFAQVLIGNPKLIVIDEPTVGLDPEQRNTIRELFPIISRDRIVLATTHIVEDIEYYSNHLLVIKEGKLTYKGSREQFIKNVDGLLWEADVDGDTFTKISRESKVITTIQQSDLLHIKYISKEPMSNNSKKVTANLQDAYIVNNSIDSDEGIE